MAKRRSPERRLCLEDVPLIKGMLKRGDLQSDIAAYFGINGARPSEINTGKRYRDVPTAPPHKLPPAGPYPSVRAGIEAKMALENARQVIDVALAIIARYESDEDGARRRVDTPLQPPYKLPQRYPVHRVREARANGELRLDR